MKLCRVGPVGQEKPAILDAGGALRDLSGVIAELDAASLAPEQLQRLRGHAASLPLLEGVPRFGACVGEGGKIVCIGLNYRDHAAESNLPVPTEPVVFIKGCRATGPDDDVAIPIGASKTDWEVELGVVIGTRAYHVNEADALSRVAGYCVVDDLSERAFQHERGGQWTKGKSAEGFAPIGPYLVTADEVPNPQNLGLWLEVNGKRYQNGTTADMVFGVASIIAYVSRFMVLYPGDIVSTGTPAGVGAGLKPAPVFLKAGDTVRLGIEGLGEQQHKMVAFAGEQA